MEHRIALKNTILDDDSLRYCEIYKITNCINEKVYIGQAVSHILNTKRYRPYGMEGRFRSHVSEAFSDKKCQCHYLNNAIRKYGKDNFTVELLHTCELFEADDLESSEILRHNSLFPDGYNLNTGGKSARHTEESRRRVSNGVMNYFRDSKFARFQEVDIDDDIDISRYVHPLSRSRIQYGWYVLIKRKKADFGGVHIPLCESKKMALEFVLKVQENSQRRRDQIAGNPPNDAIPFLDGNIQEEHG